jgi:hypothetical protein
MGGRDTQGDSLRLRIETSLRPDRQRRRFSTTVRYSQLLIRNIVISYR